MPASIFIVDDENGIRESLGALLRDEGYDVEAVASGEECLARLETRTFDLVLLDVWLKKMDGLDTLERMQAQDGAPMVVMISGHANIETAVRATKLGAFDFVEKPLSLEKVVLVVRNALEYLRLETENRRLARGAGRRAPDIGRQHSDESAAAADRVDGADERARADLRRERNRQGIGGAGAACQQLAQPMQFVEVNCAAIPEELIESGDCSGIARAALPGASEDKVGKFQKADGGTLFLDEVGDMSLKTQSKVLRVLDERRFEPVGIEAAGRRWTCA